MNNFTQRVATGSMLVAFVYMATVTPPIVGTCLLLSILAIILTCEWPLFVRRNRLLALLTPWYPIAPFIALIALHHSDQTRFYALMACLCAAAHDTGSYIVGCLFGRTRIAQSISPRKTWEGFFGGLCSVYMLLCLAREHIGVLACQFSYFFIAVVIATAALLGDLFESWLKRRVGIKDSGSLLPGHGGFLDRFDSVMAVASIFALLLWFS